MTCYLLLLASLDRPSVVRLREPPTARLFGPPECRKVARGDQYGVEMQAFILVVFVQKATDNVGGPGDWIHFGGRESLRQQF
jgi:hypothetical protein